MATLKLHTYPNNYRANKALIAAQYNGIKIDIPAFEFGKDNRTPEFLALNPTGQVPTLETPEGGIFESNAIARYVARLRQDTSLYGSSFFQSGRIDSWIDWCANNLDPARGIWIYPIFGYLQYNATAHAHAKKDVEKALTVLNNHLLNNTYLVGNRVTLADIVIVATLVEMYRMLFAPAFIAPFANVTRWFNTCVNQPEFAAVIGKVEFAKAEATPQGVAAAAAPAKKEEKKEDKKAEAKPAAAQSNADLLDALEKPQKVKSELDLLPESSMILDAVKKLGFSERPFKKSFFDELFAGIYDEKGYSFWICDYKYNDENKVFFMTSNLVSGFIQRCDACRKYAMGSMVIYGNPDEETPPFRVAGGWLFRGTEVPKVEMLSENPDSEYYEWKKVDVTSAEGKAQLAALFIGDDFRGEKVLERKFFK